MIQGNYFQKILSLKCPVLKNVKNFRTNHDLPLVNLPTVDDSYPPQKKSFLMLKYMNDLLGDKYDWFLRGGKLEFEIVIVL